MYRVMKRIFQIIDYFFRQARFINKVFNFYVDRDEKKAFRIGAFRIGAFRIEVFRIGVL